MKPVIIRGKKFGEYEIRNNILFYHTHRDKTHFMRKFLGFGISWSVLCYLVSIMNKYKCLRGFAIFHYHGERGYKKYMCPLSLFFISNKTYVDDTHLPGDFQKFVSIRDMKCLY
jgi:hypothetical protein